MPRMRLISDRRRRGFGRGAAGLGGALLLTAAAPESKPAAPSVPAATEIRADLHRAGAASLDSLRTAHLGRWLLVNVWATWCRPCVAETPDLVRLAAELDTMPFALVGISTDDMLEPTYASTRDKVGAFALKYAVRYPQLLYTGPTDTLTARLALSGVLPTTLLYDPKGTEVGRWEGKLPASALKSIKSRVS